MSGKIDAPDIVSIMVEAAEAERERYAIFQRGNGSCSLELIMPDKTGAVLATGGWDTCCKYLDHLVVQAQLRALHAAGLGIGEFNPDGAGWIEALNLIPAALRENG